MQFCMPNQILISIHDLVYADFPYQLQPFRLIVQPLGSVKTHLAIAFVIALLLYILLNYFYMITYKN